MVQMNGEGVRMIDHLSLAILGAHSMAVGAG